jgi:mannose-P-dolichol utilization defect protein 1
MTLGALAIYVPIITNMLMAKSALGLSQSTWAMNLLGATGVLMYNAHRGIPLSNYFEFFFLALQSIIINALLHFYNGTKAAVVTATAAAYVAGMAAIFRLLPASLFAPMQAAATATISWSLVPQIASNFASRTSGGWSWISALLATAGNGMRVLTTQKVAKGELMLLAQFLLGFALNGCLLVQCIVWS